MSKHAICKLCGSSQNTKIHQGTRYDPDAEIYQCIECNFVFLSPWPTEDELNLYYATEYRDHYDEPPVEIRFRQDIDEARIRMQRLLPVLPFPQNYSSTKILEIGSGSGAFLDAARPYFGETIGIEPDNDSRNWIRKELGHSVYPTLPDDSSMYGKFDLIVMFHVLEHISEPVKFLKHVAKFAHQNTKLIIEVPNIDDVLLSVYQIEAYQNFYYQKAHLAYYSVQTLEALLSQSGWTATINMIQRYDLSNHIRWMLTKSPGGQNHYKMLGSSVASVYNEALIQSGHADTLWAIAQLPTT